jgi:hypothetical protein
MIKIMVFLIPIMKLKRINRIIQNNTLKNKIFIRNYYKINRMNSHKNSIKLKIKKKKHRILYNKNHLIYLITV